MTRLALLLVIASAFGPYLISGIRTDQVVVYSLAVLALGPLAQRARLTRAGKVAAGAWVLLILTAASGLIETVANTSRWTSGSPVANADNLLLPIAGGLVTLTLIAGRDPAQVRQDVTVAVTIGTSVAAAIGILQLLLPALVAPFLPIFLGAGDTAERALTLGRYTSIFGQPSVAGAAYTVGLLCAVYAFRSRPVLQTLAVAIITAGGVLTVSKGFLLVGLPLAAALLLFTRGRAGQRVVVVVAGVGLYAAATSLGLVATWSGWSRLVDLLPGGGSDLNAYTGNRYGSASSTAPLTSAVLDEHPLVGFGMPGLDTPVDTLLVQSLVVAGLVGAACAVLMLGCVLWGWWSNRAAWDQQTTRFYGALAVALVGLSLGSPALTANRVSVLAWVLLALMLSTVKQAGRAAPEQRAVHRPLPVTRPSRR